MGDPRIFFNLIVLGATCCWMAEAMCTGGYEVCMASASKIPISMESKNLWQSWKNQLAIEQHFLAAAAEGVDFLAVERADDEAALDAIAEVLQKNVPRMVPRRGIINSRYHVRTHISTNTYTYANTHALVRACLHNSTDKEARPGGYLGKTYEDGEEEVGFKIPTYLVGDSSAQSWNAVCKAADCQQLVTGTIAVAK